MILNKNLKLIFLFALTHTFLSHSQELLPPITNYYPAAYEAAAQNWDVDIDDKGFVYIANNQGLLVYNGLSWSTHTLPENNVIRSVHVKDSLIYTGAYDEFGYWKKDSTGKLKYKSLASKAAGFTFDEELWQITSIEDNLYLRSFGKIYVYDGNKISILKDINSNTMISHNNQLYIADRRSGLCKVNGSNKIETILNKNDLENENILDFDIYNETLIIATKNKIFQYSDSKITPLGNKALWENLKKWELNKIEVIDDNSIVIGTVKNGLIVYNLETNESQVINRLNGLQNNTVLCLESFDKKLWVGLDYGVGKVDLYSPIKFYTENTGELGTVYDIDYTKEKIYLGSNTGVYFFNNNLEVLKGTEGHTWNLYNHNDILYINHNTGTFSYKDNQIQNIETKTGSFKIQKLKERPDFLVSTYTGLRHLEDTIKSIPTLDFPIKDFILENDTNLWLLGLYDGLFKVECDSSYNEVISIEKIKIPNGKIDSNTRMIYVKNQLAVFNKGEWFRYNPFENQLEVFDDFNFLKNKKPILDKDDIFWFIDIETKAFHVTDFNEFQVDFNSRQLKNRLVKNYENVIYKKDSTYLITLKDGFSEIDLTKFEQANGAKDFQKPKVVGIRSEDLRFNLKEELNLPYKKSRDLYIDIAYPNTNGIEPRYTLKSNRILKKGTINKGFLNFQNLHYGEYEIDFFIQDTKLGKVELSSFKFTISPPWYLSVYMKLVYIFLSLLTVFLIYIFNKVKLRKHKEELKENYERQKHEEFKKQEKERLLDELNFKSKELANTTLAIAKKNEILLELKEELKDNKNSVKNNFKLKRIVSKINNALNNKNDWDVFETNFNEIHDEFFKKLLKAYPDLSNSDLKLCAYLKMNMTSKEIAPLLRISLRGVEVHRYRLRKKLNLDSDQNLNKFLIKNF